MRIKVTEIEATAEELRQSTTLSDGLQRVLRNAFNNVGFSNLYNSNVNDCEGEEEPEQVG